MDDSQFDRIVRDMGVPQTRRVAVTLLGGLLAAPILASDAKNRKKKKKCKPQPTATTCAAQCGEIRNNCKKPVDCGPCTPPCTGLQPTADLQEAINAAAPGSTVTLCAGTWTVTSTLRID